MFESTIKFIYNEPSKRIRHTIRSSFYYDIIIITIPIIVIKFVLWTG